MKNEVGTQGENSITSCRIVYSRDRKWYYIPSKASSIGGCWFSTDIYLEMPQFDDRLEYLYEITVNPDNWLTKRVYYRIAKPFIYWKVPSLPAEYIMSNEPFILDYPNFNKRSAIIRRHRNE